MHMAAVVTTPAIAVRLNVIKIDMGPPSSEESSGRKLQSRSMFVNHGLSDSPPCACRETSSVNNSNSLQTSVDITFFVFGVVFIAYDAGFRVFRGLKIERSA